MVLRELPSSLLVPETAVTYDAGRHPFVDVVDATAKTGRRHVPVKVGVGNGSKIQILEGLQAGQKVVIPG